MTKQNDIKIINTMIFQKVVSATDFDAITRKHPLAFKAAIAVMAQAEKAKADAEKDKNKAFYVVMTKGGLTAFFDDNGKQNRAVAMDLSGLRKCAAENLHELPDVDFKAVITNHDKEITSYRQFATDHFKKVSDRGGSEGGENESGAIDGETETETATPTAMSRDDAYKAMLAVFGGPTEFWNWIDAGNAEQIDAALTNAKRKAAKPELPKLKSAAA